MATSVALIRETAEFALEEWYLFSGSLEEFYEEDWEEFDEDEDWQDA